MIARNKAKAFTTMFNQNSQITDAPVFSSDSTIRETSLLKNRSLWGSGNCIIEDLLLELAWLFQYIYTMLTSTWQHGYVLFRNTFKLIIICLVCFQTLANLWKVSLMVPLGGSYSPMPTYSHDHMTPYIIVAAIPTSSQTADPTSSLARTSRWPPARPPRRPSARPPRRPSCWPYLLNNHWHPHWLLARPYRWPYLQPHTFPLYSTSPSAGSHICSN